MRRDQRSPHQLISCLGWSAHEVGTRASAHVCADHVLHISPYMEKSGTGPATHACTLTRRAICGQQTVIVFEVTTMLAANGVEFASAKHSAELFCATVYYGIFARAYDHVINLRAIT